MAVGTPISLVQPAAVKSEILAYELPKTLTDQLTRFRAFGMELRKERRRLFQATLAATQVACENSQNGRDGDLYGELVRLGHSFGLL